VFVTSQQGASECKAISAVTIAIIVFMALAILAIYRQRFYTYVTALASNYRERVTKLDLLDYVLGNDDIDDIEAPLLSGSQSLNAGGGDDAGPERSRCCGLWKQTQDEPTADPTSRPWAIDYDHLTLLKKIGEGATADVFEGRYNTKVGQNREDGQPVAIKKIRLNKEDRGYKRRMKAAVMELRNLNALDHEHVLRFYGASLVEKLGQPVMHLVTELCVGSLELYIDTDMRLRQGLPLGMPILDESPSGRSRLVELMQGVISGIAYMHSRNPPVIHRDLKPQNLFISNFGAVKIGDFGLSVKHQAEDATLAGASHTIMVGIQGTPMYIAPEMIDTSEFVGNTQHYSPAVDIYAFGVVLNAMWRGEKPYNSTDFSSPTALLQAVKGSAGEDGVRPHIPTDCPGWLVEVMESCWAGNLIRRMSAAEVTRAFRDEAARPATGPVLKQARSE
jgi:serine/threonine protein kinase